MKNNGFLKVVVLSVFFIQMGLGIITPAIDSIAKAFPEIPFTTILLVQTLPLLTAVIAALVSGRLAGRLIKYKTLIIIGCLFFIIGGCAPYFLQDFSMILVCRGLFGIGTGLILPLGSALIIAFFAGEERAKVMGLSNVVLNLGGIVLTMMGGIAAAVLWRYNFLVSALAIIPLLLVFFLPEPEKAPIPQSGEAVQKMPKVVYAYAATMFASMMLIYPMFTNMSSIITAGGMGDAAVAGLVLTMVTVGGMLAGAIFAKVFGVFKQNALVVGLILCGLAMTFIAVGNSIVFMYIAATLGGMGISIIMPVLMMGVGSKVHPSQVPVATSYILAALNIGGFASVFFFALFGNLFGMADNLIFPFYVSIVCFALMIVGFILINIKGNAMAKNKSIN